MQYDEDKAQIKDFLKQEKVKLWDFHRLPSKSFVVLSFVSLNLNILLILIDRLQLLQHGHLKTSNLLLEIVLFYPPYLI